MKFYLKTLGCKVNQYEGAIIAELLEKNGYTEVKAASDADILIINSCTVTENADKKIKQLLKSKKADNPDLITAIIGCYPQAFPNGAAEAGADIITGTSERRDFPQILRQYLTSKQKKTQILPTEKTFEDFGEYGTAKADKTRAVIKIEDGCNRSCAYCIIPTARGRVRSRAINDILNEVKISAANKNKEIVLAGINLSDYGTDLGITLCDAVEAAAEINGIERIRLSSLEPDLMTDDIIKRLGAVKKLCPHFHLSLQSGCDRTLARMNRLYGTKEYAQTVKLIRETFDNPSVTTDIIVGFAGETDEEFADSHDFIREIMFAKIHVFTYSKRAGTAAAERSDHIEKAVKAERYRVMNKTAAEAEQSFLTSQIGKTVEVLIEKRTNSEFLFGHARNYAPVRIYGTDAERYDIINVKITGASDSFCCAD